MNRRDVLRVLGAASGSLVLGALSSGCAAVRTKDIQQIFEQAQIFQPNAFLSLHPDGRIVLAMNKSEMGQGIMTASATLVAEELDVPVSSVDVYQAYKLEFGNQVTGGSNSTKEIFLPIREAAASAREMLRQAAAELWAVPLGECTAKDGTIQHLSGKTFAYGDLVSAAAQQKVPQAPPLKSREDFTRIGQAVQRVDALAKSTGRAEFGMDVQIEGKVCAYVIRPPVMGAQVKSMSSQKAAEQVGVIQIFAYERGVAVIAEKYWQARRAAQWVEIEWGEGLVQGLDTQEMAEAARQQSLKKGSHISKNVGKIESVFERSDVKQLELQFDFPYLSHATMEPQNCTAAVYGDRITLWVPTQAPTMCARAAADIMGISHEDVEVNITLLGGGFGRRSAVDFVMDAVYVARQIPNTPVQVIWSREDDMSFGYYRPQGTCRMRGAVDNAGDILGLHAHLVSQAHFPDMQPFLMGMFPAAFPPKLRQKLGDATISFVQTTGLMGLIEGGEIVDTKYALPHFRFEYTPITTQVPVTAWRSVAHSYSTFIMESVIDQLIQLGSQDPIAVRRKLLAEHPRHLTVMDTVISESGWGKPIEAGWGRGFAISEFFGSVVAQVVEAGIVNGRIAVRHVNCAVDCGLVVNPDIVRAQVESAIIYGLSMMDEKIELVDGVVQQRNFDSFPVLRMNEVPEIKTSIIPSERHPSGIGEIALPPINAAVANAIFAATGHRLTDMPLQDAWTKAAQAEAVQR